MGLPPVAGTSGSRSTRLLLLPALQNLRSPYFRTIAYGSEKSLLLKSLSGIFISEPISWFGLLLYMK